MYNISVKINLSNLAKLNKRYFASMVQNDISNAVYCANSVKKYDYENFLCTLLISDQEIRRSSFALRAFNVELARIPSVVSDNKIALMRLKFWEDGIAKLFNKSQNTSVTQHPVIEELNLALRKTSMTKRNFDRLINSRKMVNLNFITTKQMEQYAEETVSAMHYLVLEAHNCKNVNADHAASHLGKAQGICNLLRSIYVQRSHQYLPIPQELLIKQGISQERFYRNKDNDKAVENVVFEIATLAHQHLEKATSLVSKVPKEAKITFLPMVSTRRFLEKLRQVNFNLTDKSIGKRDNLLPLVLYWTKFRGL